MNGKMLSQRKDVGALAGVADPLSGIVHVHYNQQMEDLSIQITSPNCSNIQVYINGPKLLIPFSKSW